MEEVPRSTGRTILGIRLAPAKLPIERRLQTAVVFFYSLTYTVLPAFIMIAFTISLFTPLFPISASYLLWIVYDVYVNRASSRGGRTLQSVRKHKIWNYFRDFFPVSLVKTAELDPNKNYLLGYHPHGIIGCGAVCNFASESTGFSEKYPGIKPHLLTLKNNFNLPFWREYLLFSGMCDVSKDSIEWILTKQGTGNAAIIVIGGAEEALEARPSNFSLTLKNRNGFIRMAIKTGASLVPVFSFGENDVYYQASNPKGSILRRIQEQLKSLVGFSPPLFYGRGIFNYTFGFLPHRRPITTIVGGPIPVEKCETPTREMVDAVHQKYMDALSQLFEDNKLDYNVEKDTKKKKVPTATLR